MKGLTEAINAVPRRVEGGGTIRWYVNNVLVIEVTTDAYYRGGHVHPEGCECDALVHDAEFQANLARRFRTPLTMLDSLRCCHGCGHTRDRHTNGGPCGERGCGCDGFERICANCGHAEGVHGPPRPDLAAIPSPQNNGCRGGDPFICRCQGFEPGGESAEGKRELRRVKRLEWERAKLAARKRRAQRRT